MSQRIRAPNSLRDRSTLLGHSTPSSSGRASPLNNNSQYQPNGQRFVDDLEGQNDEALESLSNKVKLLKNLTVGIGNEVRESTVQLSQMNDAFAETGDILSGTFRRMNNMAERHGCKWLWYIVFFVIVFWFFIVVWWFRR
ncbi:protein transport protein BET1 [Coprinopsis marcescibilis]|uniref:Protein transport protein BET1 n=1 Tax=Coprinopsis marcescibilis TaxID=230819 RepID=A0A5C3KIR7_COPMA|nr:protein transport protein BET1 [Coprinopsis marcescibilis]